MKQRQVHVKITATETIRVKHRKNSLKMNNVIICGTTWGILIYMELDFPKVQGKNFFEEQWLFYKMDENLKPQNLRSTMNQKCLNHENKNQRNKKKILKAVLDKRHAMNRRTKIRMTANSRWKQRQRSFTVS